MSDFYEEEAANYVSAANAGDDYRDAYGELASELLTLARISREAA